MIQFKKMLETFTRKGILGTWRDTGESYHLGPNELKYLQFLGGLDHVQHFVFTPKEQPEGPKEPGECEAVEELDLPFKAISIEVLGAPITSPRITDELKITTHSLYVIERKPKDYLIFIHITADNGADEVVLVKDDDHHFKVVVQSYLDRLAKEKEGVQTVREKLKVGSGHAKRFHTIRRLIYVTPKKQTESLTRSVGKPIDWSQRWMVRGHWRKVPTIGKDREGQYCVEGFTWVTEFTKGPEHLPLIPKVRLVKDL